jgi:putative salt-induced outer membrane protein
MSKYVNGLLLPFVLIALCLNTLAEEVVLKNGDRLSGRIVERSEEKLTIETEYAGTITIKAEHIKDVLKPAAPATSATTAETPAPKTSADANPQPNTLSLFGGRMMGLTDGWEGNANIGFSFSAGNTRTSTLTTGIRAVKTGGIDKLTVYTRSQWHTNRNNGSLQTTQNAVWGGARYDRDLTDKQFGFISYDFERDRPKKLYFRSVLGGGTGYHAVKNERTELDVLVGGAWNRTWQQGANTDTPEALAGAALKHKFHDRLKLQNSISFFQNVTDRNEYRLIFDATISADITKRIGWHVTVGDRFNNDPSANAKKNDVLFTTGLRWNFGTKK